MTATPPTPTALTSAAPTSAALTSALSRRQAGGLGAALLGALGLAACGTGAAAPGAEVSEEDRVDGGELRIYHANITVLDPRQNHGIVGRALADSLIDADPDTGEILPWLASAWEVSDDGLTFAFTLREGVTFSDGTPLDAEVVKLNLDQAAQQVEDGEGWYFQGLFDDYEGTEAVSELEAEVTFSAPNPSFLPTLATGQLAILAPSAFDLTYEQRDNGEFLASGPFVLESYTPNEGIVLSRREDYAWPSGAATHEGPASLETITISFVDEQSVRESALQAGEADIAQNPTNEGADQLEAAGYQLTYRAQSGIPYSLVLNFSVPALQDIAVRRALSAAIDREAIHAGVTGDRQPASTSVITPLTTGYSDVSDLLVHDPDGAVALLEEAGWVEGPDGIREKDGEKLSFELILWWEPQEVSDALQLIKEQLAETGIEITVREDIGGAGGSWRDGKSQLHLNNATRAAGELALYSQYTNDNFESASLIEGADFGSTLDEFTETGTLSDIVTRQVTEADEETRAELLAEAQRIIVGDAIRIPLFDNINSESGFFASAPTVHGLRSNTLSELVLSDAWRSEG
ncbi:ABC transporter substrate-binding protein [Brachybacterium sp. AOP43-C2-M15]|uniref:ABC transporter substrate-binding protein n=1 Tax=Brachybacterium sp. AOP43-C2-M15 TaxID=3457661 RepID=UPI004033A637